MHTAQPCGSGRLPVIGIAFAAAALVTVWWGFVGLATENFGSDCVRSFGETGPRAERCLRVNDRAETWLPRVVFVVWAGAVLSLVTPCRYSLQRGLAVVATWACVAVAVVLGVHAFAVSAR